ncbi:substrate-binding domain-containing protein [Alicyclobacillus acidoterrestris]|uniref:Helix-turn-helix domain-containing protein n=1 Tax=Alicyclobacillus acidoterrestris (strain ATCC 49025 / DSM 3922 / CIP 106132 / NCIMB 13137 / GD3B) TaxID=1356854 RepID=T0BMI3_ALIAG|nr:substrate-binding domain-containing protein [Alicyclobacillus acidoterrestris]EPZ45223.1 hypothetical protein N007_09475 [Alicyclobacillus acidoterrestris ATCC 49025]UNO49889.1 helix-turn-helix domain-containing protein [Alicyclobacillus acidoterrestris]
MLENQLRALRNRAHMSQAQLASAIQVSRQTIQAIESGTAIPSTLVALRLARVFGVRVEDIFRERPEEPDNRSFVGDEELEAGDRVVVTEIDGRRVAHRAVFELGQRIPLATESHIVAKRLGKDQVELEQFDTEQSRPWTIVSGCDPALGLLANYVFDSNRDCPVYWLNADNAKATKLLAGGAIQIAAIHQPSRMKASLLAPLDDVRSYHRVHLADWELGWVVKRGNPCGFTDASDLASGKTRLVNRPIGAGARTLLDERLQEAGVQPQAVAQYSWTVAGHMQVGMAIESGAADVGIAIAGIASAMHLDFIPIQEECCDLWIPTRLMEQSGVQRVLDCLSSDIFRWDLARFGPYDTNRTGVLETVHDGIHG